MASSVSLKADNPAVFIAPETAYLSEISQILQKEGYRMFTDSTKNTWIGELDIVELQDSLLFQLIIHSEDGLNSKNIGSFSKAGLNRSQQRQHLKTMLSLQLLTALIVSFFYFVRF